MRKRQSSKRKVKNANSPKKEKPPDILHEGLYIYIHSPKIKQKEKLILIFLTKKYRPKCAQEIQNEVRILKSEQSGRLFADSNLQKEKILIQEIKELKQDIILLSRLSPDFKIGQQYKKEKESFLEGLEYIARYYDKI